MSYQSDSIRWTHYNETHHDPKQCICGGSGWWNSEYDSWEKCGIMSHAGPHPEMDYCQGCHGYDCWRPRGYLSHPMPLFETPPECGPYSVQWDWLDSREGA